MIIDGKRIAEEVYVQLPHKPLTLGILVGEKNPVIDSFVRIKERAAERLGVKLVREELPAGGGGEIDAEAVLAAIPPEKDVDGISPHPHVRPPVAEAIAEILTRAGVQVFDAKSVVVGSGRLVGKPAAALLADLGAHVTVMRKGDSLAALKDADIVILGAGEPGLVKPEHLKQGVVLIDAGTSEMGGKVAGDADPACAEIASVFTPVPGGVGPIAVAMIFKNLFDLSAE